MTARILVTGGAGYIGSVVVEQLLQKSFHVVVLDNLTTGHRAAIPDGAELVQGDIGDRSLLDRLLQEPTDAIIHLAALALVSESVTQPEQYHANNVTAARALLDAAADAKVRRFVFSSSCAVYGHPDRVPISEDTPQKPVNPYGETKRDFERLLGEYSARHNLSAVSLRYFNAAGATTRGEDHDPETHLIPNILLVAAGKRPAVDVFGTDYPTPDGTAIRDYVHVADIANAHLKALEATSSLAVNLGTGDGQSVRQVVDAAARITGKPLRTVDRPRRPGDPPALVAAVGRAADLLGWRPQHSKLEEILESAWRWHRMHPNGYRS